MFYYNQIFPPNLICLCPYTFRETLKLSVLGVEFKTVQYDQLTGLLIEAIKDLKAEIEELKNASAK